ncbi:MAG: SDR family NAD(P)-dependent oxidoreductase, partial [Spirochaetota bacterium]
VVFIATTASEIGMSFHASVSTSKTALIGLSRSLAAEYASKSLRFNVVAPSLTDTPLAGALLNNDKKRDRSAERHPLKRIGRPEDIAGAVEYFLSPDASWVTGQVLAVDGGMSSVSGL